eukprot:6178775-Pleurochrysis_carterae.AAC.2
MALGPRELCHFEAPHAEQVAAGRVGGRERHCQLEVLGDGEGALDLRARAFKRRGRAEQDAAPLVRGAAVRLHQHGAPRVRQPVPHEALLCARLRLGLRQLVQRARLAPEQLGVVGALGERSAHERLQLDVPDHQARAAHSTGNRHGKQAWEAGVAETFERAKMVELREAKGGEAEVQPG